MVRRGQPCSTGRRTDLRMCCGIIREKLHQESSPVSPLVPYQVFPAFEDSLQHLEYSNCLPNVSLFCDGNVIRTTMKPHSLTEIRALHEKAH